MPVDIKTGDRKDTITYEEFKRHTILLDKETYDRVDNFIAVDDGKVCMPGDETYTGAIYAIPKHAHLVAPDAEENRPETVVYPAYTGTERVAPDSELYKCISEKYGEDIAQASLVHDIIHDPYTNLSIIKLATTRFCPLAGREHKKNHPYITISQHCLCIKCHRKCVDVEENLSHSTNWNF